MDSKVRLTQCFHLFRLPAMSSSLTHSFPLPSHAQSHQEKWGDSKAELRPKTRYRQQKIGKQKNIVYKNYSLSK
jgi:hypothetical protein